MAAPGAPSTAISPRRVSRALLGLGIVVVVLLAIGAAALAWLRSPAALAFAVDQLKSRSGDTVTIRDATGSLLSAIHIGEITYADAEKRVSARDVTLTWSPAALLHRELHVRELGAAEIEIMLGGGGEPKVPQSLALPLDVAVDRAAVGRLLLRSGKAQWPIHDIHFAYRGGAMEHRLTDIGLVAEAGTLAGNVELGARAPFPVRGRIDLAGTPALRSPQATVQITGQLQHVELNATGSIAQAELTAHVVLEPITATPLQRLDLALRELDLHAVDARFPVTRLALQMHGLPAPDAVLAGTFAATNGAPGPIDVDHVPIRSLRTDFILTADAINLRGLDGVLSDGAQVAGNGTLHLAAGTPGAAGSEWALRVSELNLASLHGKLTKTRLSGRIDANLAEGVQKVDASLVQEGMALEARAQIAGTIVDLAHFSVRAQGGELNGSGRFDWSGARTYQVSATARALDPSRFGDFPPARLDASVDAEGQLQPSPVVNGTLVIAPTSRYRDVAIAGRVAGSFMPDRVTRLAANLRVGSATARANGALGRAGDQLHFVVNSTRLQDLQTLAPGRWPEGLRGALQASGTAQGAFAGLGLTIEAHGTRLFVGANGVGTVDLTASVAPGSGYTVAALRSRPLSVDVRATQVTWQERTFARLQAQVTGSLAQHTARLALQGENIDLTAALGGGFAPASAWSASALAWSGTLRNVENRGTYAARLLAPAHLDASATRVTLDDARIALADGAVNVVTFDWHNGAITSRGDFTGLPVASIARLTGADLPVRTTLVLGGQWNVAANPRLNGTVRIRREAGDVFASTEGLADTPEMAMGLAELSVDGTLAEDAIEVSASMTAARVGKLSGAVSIGRVAGAPPGRILPSAALSGTVRAEIASLKPLQSFTGTKALVDGTVRADLVLAGTVGAPRATGILAASGLRADAPQYGLHWHDGVLRAHADADLITIDEFSIVGGDGRFHVTGTLPVAALMQRGRGDAVAHVAWHADHFRAANRPDLRLVTSGDGTVGYARGRLALRGDLRIDEGRIEFEQHPGARLGDDVVVVGREPPTPRRKAEDVPLDLDLNVDLGTRFAVAGSGLRTTLEGRARFTTTSAGTLTARGTVRTSHGTYSAFGQQLTIERGQLIFDGPIDNPTLDIVALRKNLPVEAGVELTGTVRLPRVRLTSDPPVSDGEKLSWLVLGQGLERTSGTDVAALQAAAAALFGSTGPSIGTRVAQRFGLDDLSIRTGSSASAAATGTAGVNTQVLAFSKRITDRLYVVYEAGLSVANNALRIEYALSRSFTIRAQAGTVSSLGVYFLRSFQ